MNLSSDSPTLPELDPKTGYQNAVFDSYPQAFSRNLSLLLDKLNLMVASVRYGTNNRFAQLMRELFTLSIADYHESITGSGYLTLRLNFYFQNLASFTKLPAQYPVALFTFPSHYFY